MIPPVSDLWRLAKRLVEVYGANALPEAAKRSDDFRSAGDLENAEVWNRVFDMVTDLLNTEPENGERRH
jgi:hypothetical protein